MRARMATVVGTLLILSAFGLPTTTAKTGDATCAGEEVWFDDADGDGGYNVPAVPGAAPVGGGTQFVPAGELDIDTLTIEERTVANKGNTCGHLEFSLAVGDSSAFSVDGAISGVVIQVDLSGAGTPEWRLIYSYGSAGPGVELQQNGVAVDDAENITTVDDDDGDGELHIVVNKTMFAGDGGFVGVRATVIEALFSPVPDSPAGPNPKDSVVTFDTATSSDVFLVNFGVDSDEDGMPDVWEEKNFGHLNATTRTDTDGDGHSDVDEYLMGTDPNDPNSPLQAPDPYPTVTHPDDDDEFGMLPEHLDDPLGNNDAYSFTFDTSGTFPFFSDQHKTMGGSIIVQSTGASGGARTYVMEIYGEEDDAHGSGDHSHSLAGFRVLNGTQAGNDDVTINKGDTVIFWNTGDHEHMVRSGNGEDFIDGGFDENDGGADVAYLATTSIGVVVVVGIVLVGLLGRWKP